MISKINLLKGEKNIDTFSDIKIIECAEGTAIIYEKEIILNPHQSTSSLKSDGEKDILFVISGNGIIQIDTVCEKGEEGDRIEIPSGQNYVILNEEDKTLHFRITGIGRI